MIDQSPRRDPYQHPLFSFEFVPDCEAAAAPEARSLQQGLAVPGGRLVVAPGLLRRGRLVATPACARAVDIGLRAQERHLDDLAAFGLTAAWACSMRHWTQHILALEQLRGEEGLAQERRSAARQELFQKGHALWRRVVVAARLAGIPGGLTRGAAAPRSVAELAASLRYLHVRAAAPEHARRLKQHGFTAAHCGEVAATATALSALAEQACGGQAARQAVAAELAVVRGALLGDLLRLRYAASAVMPAREAAELTLHRLLPSWQRQRTSLHP